YLEVVVFINENLYTNSSEYASVPHKHPDYELWYTERGTCSEAVEQERYDLHAGDLLLIPPMSTHFRYPDAADGDSTQYNLRFSLKMPPQTDKGTAPLRAYRSANRLLRQGAVLHDESGSICAYLRQLTTEMHRRNAGYVHTVRALSSLILTEAFRLLGDGSKLLFPPDELRFHGYERTRIDEFFRRKYCLPEVRIEDLAKDMQMSVRQVNRVLVRMFGMPFTQKLREMRLQYAAMLLRNGDLSVAEISRRCGFRSYPYFEVCFRQEYRMTPTEYRERSADQA
ncbi:MAG TPA: hypothetical protein DDW30_00385, partial [Clostridiales bacterium]|nr:hypothetical protein [Clostridiales bacterium]